MVPAADGSAGRLLPSGAPDRETQTGSVPRETGSIFPVGAFTEII